MGQEGPKALTRGYSHTSNGSINNTLEDTKERLLKCYDDHRAVGTLTRHAEGSGRASASRSRTGAGASPF